MMAARRPDAVATARAPRFRARVQFAVRRCRFNTTHPYWGQSMRDHLETELAQAAAELKAHMATWEYAFAMAGGCHGGRDHPVHWATATRADKLTARCRELRARLAEYEY
jgi:hypothetical protein